MLFRSGTDESGDNSRAFRSREDYVQYIEDADARKSIRDWSDPYGGGIKRASSDQLRRILDIAALIFLTRFTRKPLRFFGLAGGGIFTVGLVTCLVLLVEFILGGDDQNTRLKNRAWLIFGALMFSFFVGISGVVETAADLVAHLDWPKLAVVLLLLYASTLVSEVIAPYHLHTRDTKHIYAPPQEVHLFHEGSFVGPFVYGYTMELNMQTLTREYTPDPAKVQPLRFFCRGDEYEFWGMVEGRFHLVCPAEGEIGRAHV